MYKITPGISSLRRKNTSEDCHDVGSVSGPAGARFKTFITTTHERGGLSHISQRGGGKSRPGPLAGRQARSGPERATFGLSSRRRSRCSSDRPDQAPNERPSDCYRSDPVPCVVRQVTRDRAGRERRGRSRVSGGPAGGRAGPGVNPLAFARLRVAVLDQHASVVHCLVSAKAVHRRPERGTHRVPA